MDEAVVLKDAGPNAVDLETVGLNAEADGIVQELSGLIRVLGELPSLRDKARVIPGLIALIGLTGFVWPIWLRTTSGGRPMIPDDYSLPSPDGAPAAPFLTCFRACSPTSAWFMVSGQGLAPAGAIYQIMSHRDVQATLRSLDATHHVVTVGDTPRLLEPLTGRKLEPGEAPMLLPVCDCGLLSEALDQLRSELGALVVQVRQAAATYRSRAATYPLDIPGSQQVCMRLMASIWTQLVGDRQIRVSTLAQKNWWMMMLDQGKALTEFAGVMVLYGDHWALWNKIQALQQQLS